VGGSRADTFVVLTDALLFDANGVMLDTISGGNQAASTYDQITIGTSGTEVNIVATDDFSKLTNVEQIAVAANSAAISLVLGASAQSAGLNRVTLAGDATAGGANTVNVSAYSTATTLVGSANADTITGGSGNDTITGGVGADSITAGGGNDTIVILLTADADGTNVIIDTVNGGDGTDTILVGTNGTAFDIAAADLWTNYSNVEKLQAAGNTAAVTLALAATAWTAGIREVDSSAGSAATGNTINIGAVTGGGMTLRGSSTGVTTFTGGSGADTIYGGSANDVISGGGGADSIMFASTAALNGNDTITFVPASDVLNFSAFLGANYSILGSTGLSTAITAISGTADVNIAGKLVLIEEAAGTTNYDTAQEIFDAIDGTGDLMALSSGKAVIVRQVDGAGTDTAAALIFYVDTTLDGAAGLSVSDIQLVGTLTDMVGTATVSFTTANFA
jgi:Ca2+-binding RTX toxin-like protein